MRGYPPRYFPSRGIETSGASPHAPIFGRCKSFCSELLARRHELATLPCPRHTAAGGMLLALGGTRAGRRALNIAMSSPLHCFGALTAHIFRKGAVTADEQFFVESLNVFLVRSPPSSDDDVVFRGLHAHELAHGKLSDTGWPVPQMYQLFVFTMLVVRSPIVSAFCGWRSRPPR